ncbi:MAG: 1-deoxy-D-xylulose-5-phosphate synthase [Deltaproteobacteria bacterium]|jgi:1-deoxy-D-xylulose-5-phosphate synthase|nr:1-deoxy-D-xylulose-5-phosphate synthase [Deltaproteobacteria bacterium]
MTPSPISGGLLASINDPAEVQALNAADLPFLAQEIRSRIIEAVSNNGGHLASPLGVVELTIALLRVFNPKSDRIIWDVGHQAYAYKLLTGRVENFHTLRQLGGVSGFPKMSESPYDHFGAGHASTSISAALGMALAREQNGLSNHVLAVVGDGAMTGGMVYEAMNHAGAQAKPLIVVFNDNQMSISKNVGALSYFLSRNLSSRWLRRVKREVSDFLQSVPGVGEDMLSLAKRSKKSFKTFFTPGILFEALRFEYLGPVNGHDFAELEQALNLAAAVVDKPVLVHVLTQKGKGYQPAESDPANYHGIGRFNPHTGDVEAPNAGDRAKSFTQIFSSSLCELAAADNRIVAISAAMPEGTGLGAFAEKFPTRFFDVGICEQHAVTLAAGMASQGLKPVVAVYSTFMQRAYDQVLHDVCLQNLPVVFALDRAGLVGEDGPTHHGVFDISYLRHIPNLSILAPRGRRTLKRALTMALKLGTPVAVRYPRGECPYIDKPDDPDLIKEGRGEILRQVKARGNAQGNAGLAVIAVGSLVHPVCLAVDELTSEGFFDSLAMNDGCAAISGQSGKSGLTVYDPIWLKPLPKEEILDLASSHAKLLVIEEHALAGGLGSAILELVSDAGLAGHCRVLRHGLPDAFVEHGKAGELRAALKLDVLGLKDVITRALGRA